MWVSEGSSVSCGQHSKMGSALVEQRMDFCSTTHNRLLRHDEYTPRSGRANADAVELRLLLVGERAVEF
jgi:hypothetical protein